MAGAVLCTRLGYAGRWPAHQHRTNSPRGDRDVLHADRGDVDVAVEEADLAGDAGDRLEGVVEVAGDLNLADGGAAALLEQEAALHDAGELAGDRVAGAREARDEDG